LEEAVRLILMMWVFHAEVAILEPKPVREPHPPIMIAGGGEQLTLRVVARLGDARNLTVELDQLEHKLEVLRRHSDDVGRDYDAIEKTSLLSILLARDDAQVAAKRERLSVRGPLRGGCFRVKPSAFGSGSAGHRFDLTLLAPNAAEDVPGKLPTVRLTRIPETRRFSCLAGEFSQEFGMR
jgi:alkanesulfonate monooxygenase SsuD/methylene tetrahydromethanopterin reductase-like flavin-dependent oxidoreductase (luciferase family)